MPLVLLFAVFGILFSNSPTLALNPDGNIVYYYGVAEPAIVMLTGHQEFDKMSSQLSEKLGLKQTDQSRVLPRELLPPLLQQTNIELLTPQGRIRANIKQATLKMGCAYWQLNLQTDKEDHTQLAQGIARLGAPFPPTAKLKGITGTLGTEKAVLKIAQRFKAWVERKLPSDVRERYQKLRMTAGDFRFERGTFGHKGKWLAWADLADSESRKQDNGETTFRVGAILDEAGETIETLGKPSVGFGDGIGGWSPLFSIDTDGDGLEELVYSTSYYEGGSILIRHEREGKVFITTIMSDGC